MEGVPAKEEVKVEEKLPYQTYREYYEDTYRVLFIFLFVPSLIFVFK
jgi:hypothetical protein